MKSIYIYGASGHGLVVADVAKSNGFDDIIFIDDGENDFLNFEEMKEKNNIPIALGIGSNFIRKALLEKLIKYNFDIKTLIHPSAIIFEDVCIDIGSVIMPGVIINSNSKIGKASILNSGCIIEHECIISDYVHISPGAVLAGNVNVGCSSHIGLGTNIIQGLEIGDNCIVGAGSVVTKNISDDKKAYGNPCREIEDIK